MTGNCLTHKPTVAKIAKVAASFLIVMVIGFFYIKEFKKNSVDLFHIKLAFNTCYLMSALILSLLSYLIEIFIWKSIIRRQPGCAGITLRQITAILYASGLFRYLPGRIWTFTAQSLWLKKYGITKSLIIYINVVCVIELIIVSLYFGLLYIAIYSGKLSVSMLIMMLASLILVNILFNCYSNILINRLFVLAGRIIKTEIQPINISLSSMVVIQLIVAVSWILTGLAAYFLAKGVGLHIVPTDMIPLISAMPLSWLAGYLAVILPGGLGVREGMMLLILKPVLVVQTALLLPILSRVMFLLSEALLGLMALFLGMRHNVFSFGKNDEAR